MPFIRDSVPGDVSAIAAMDRHRVRHSFSRAGLLPAIGRKHGRRADSLLTTRPLDEKPAGPPAGR